MKLFIERFLDTPMPRYATDFSAGLDIHAVVKGNLDHVVIMPHDTVMIDTGLKIQPEEGYHVELFPRSGLAFKLKINLANCVGVIDRDYDKEVKVLLHNNGTEPVTIHDGERVVQMQVKRTEQVKVVSVDSLPKLKSNRDGGFGSTGR